MELFFLPFFLCFFFFFFFGGGGRRRFASLPLFIVSLKSSLLLFSLTYLNFHVLSFRSFLRNTVSNFILLIYILLHLSLSLRRCPCYVRNILD